MGKIKVILSGGGTGGHIYPAVAVAQELEKMLGTEVEILFVGAEGKMEMEKIPALGYKIVGLPVAGLQRRLTAKNLLLPFKVVSSLIKARNVVRDFGADVAVGFGGYASMPVLLSAQMLGVPTLIQEQNSYAGVTNKLLCRGAKKICVAYEGMDRFFDGSKIVYTGNPLRGGFSRCDDSQRAAAVAKFGLNADKPVVLVVGGSLGSRTFNNMMKRNVDRIVADGEFQVIWQVGKFYQNEIDNFMSSRSSDGVWRGAFIDDMKAAYTAADVVVARSGACTVSELSLVGKPTIFVPSPNVAEDHQTKNARALSDRGAALLIEDQRAGEELFPAVKELLADQVKLRELSENILKLGTPDAAKMVAEEVVRLAKRGEK